MDLTQSRICVTGGAGFLGSFLIDRLRGQGVPSERIVVPRSVDYDLTREPDVERLYAEHAPDVVIHLAAQVGGIGANQANPGWFFYANLAMGHLLWHHQGSRRHHQSREPAGLRRSLRCRAAALQIAQRRSRR